MVLICLQTRSSMLRNARVVASQPVPLLPCMGIAGELWAL